jgi:hypothetical protein
VYASFPLIGKEDQAIASQIPRGNDSDAPPISPRSQGTRVTKLIRRKSKIAKDKNSLVNSAEFPTQQGGIIASLSNDNLGEDFFSPRASLGGSSQEEWLRAFLHLLLTGGEEKETKEKDTKDKDKDKKPDKEKEKEKPAQYPDSADVNSLLELLKDEHVRQEFSFLLRVHVKSKVRLPLSDFILSYIFILFSIYTFMDI